MANYNWSTKIQAYLAKIAGKEVDNLPEPTTKEQALLKEIAENGSSGGGGSSETVIVDTQMVAGVTPSDPSFGGANYVLTTTESYGDPASYNGKLAVAQIIRSGESLKLTGTLSAYTVDGGTFVGGELGDGASAPLCYLELGNDSAKIEYYDSEPGEELTIKVSVTQPNVLFVNWDFIEGSSHRVLKTTWREINEAMMIRGIPVMIEGDWTLPAIGIRYNDQDINPFKVAFIAYNDLGSTLSVSVFETNDPDGYPAEAAID